MKALGETRAAAALAALVLAALTLAGKSAQAQVGRPVGQSARMAGFGDAGHTVGLGYDALLFNPASMSQAVAYEIHLGYLYDGHLASHAPSVGIVDSATNPLVALGVSYSYWNAGNDDQAAVAESQAHQVRAALSSGYRSESLSIFAGAGMRWLDLDIAGGDHDAAWGIDAGILIGVGDMFRLGVVGHNLLDTDPRFDTPRSLAAGASIAYESFLAAFDAVIDFDTADDTKAAFHSGLQYVLVDMIPLRLGFVADRVTERSVMTSGVGFWSPAFAVDVGYQHNVERSEDFRVGVDFRLYVP